MKTIDVRGLACPAPVLKTRTALEGKDFDRLLKASFKLFLKKTGGVIRFYENAFPPITVTGFECELDCKHCHKHYLKHMIPIKTPEELVKVCEKLHRKGVKGVLLSGGSRKDNKRKTKYCCDF